MAPPDGRKALALKMRQKLAETRRKSAGNGSPVTPRRQLLMDRVASLEATTAALTTDNTELKENIDVLVSRANDLGRRLHNKTRQVIRARGSSAKLRGDLIHSKRTRAVQAGRLGRRKADGIRKALLDVQAEPNKHWMKGKRRDFHRERAGNDP
ncbi:hypothetical protein B0H14DRAFT_2628319 [Mycena olivaceomarginata]|nr:hypothetical protein B0H14DRAFT_2628319 [Mycena olivaceomarginata]